MQVIDQLGGRRVLVVGASSGIGRAVAAGAAASGAAVVAAARRRELVEALASQAGPAIRVLSCDVTDPDAARQLPRRAAAEIGGLDAVVYAAGVAPLGAVSSITSDQWHTTLSTNVVGAAMVVAGALEPLWASAHEDTADPEQRPSRRPTVVLLSTHTVPRPWPGLVAYAASKAALDALARGLREEEPWLRVVDVAVHNTATGFADTWDPDEAGRAFERWSALGYLSGPVFSAQEMAVVVLGALADARGPDDVSVIVADPAEGDR